MKIDPENDNLGEDQENQDAPENDADSENENDGPEPENESDSDENAEDQADGEGDEQDGEDSGKDESEEEVDPRDEKINTLTKELESIKESLNKPKSEEQDQQPKQHVYSEEEKQRISDAAKMPFESVQFVNGMMTNVVAQIKAYVESALGEVRGNTAVEQFAKNENFKDAPKYRKAMDEYLAKQPAHLRSKAETIETAYHIARSKGLKSTVQAVNKSKDKNKRILTQGRPKGGESKGSGSVSLTKEEVSMARAAGMSLEEYAKYKQPLHAIK